MLRTPVCVHSVRCYLQLWIAHCASRDVEEAVTVSIPRQDDNTAFQDLLRLGVVVVQRSDYV